MSAVQGGEDDHEEGGRVLPCVGQVGEGPLGVSVAPQTLDEAEPGGQALDDRPHPVRVRVARHAARLPCTTTATTTGQQQQVHMSTTTVQRQQVNDNRSTTTVQNQQVKNNNRSSV